MIGQYVATRRDPTLYCDPGDAEATATFTGSVLLAYKLNWQTVLYAGYGDNRELTTDPQKLVPVGEAALRQALVRLPAVTTQGVAGRRTHAAR